MTTPRCYSCQHRGSVPGSAHSACRAVSGADALAGAWRSIRGAHDPRRIRLNPHGVKHGWAFWPINFDPVWIEHCGLSQPTAPAQPPEEAAP